MNNKLLLLLVIAIIGIGALLDIGTTIVALDMGFNEVGNALFGLQFISASGLAVFIFSTKRLLRWAYPAMLFFPAVLCFVAPINNILVMVL